MNGTLGIRDILEQDRDKYTPKNLHETKPVGEWIYDTTIAGMRYYRCSICANGYNTIANECEVNWWRFCPRCGSKMFTKDNKEEVEND